MGGIIGEQCWDWWVGGSFQGSMGASVSICSVSLYFYNYCYMLLTFLLIEHANIYHGVVAASILKP